MNTARDSNAARALKVQERRFRSALTELGQSHIFSRFANLNPTERLEFFEDLESLSLEELRPLLRTWPPAKQADMPPLDQLCPVKPSCLVDLPELERRNCAKRAFEAVSKGQVAVITVAGGQGSRLGFDGPKGTFPIAPLSGHSLFQIFAQTILRESRRFERKIPWYLMTSPSTHQATVQYFLKNNNFGLDADQIHFFCQGQMPALSAEGKILMQTPSRLALAPNGHGGLLEALDRSGCLSRMLADGIDYLSYFQVDNPLVNVIDPVFLGMHINNEADVSAKAIQKSSDTEGLGNFCLRGQRLHSIEYSDLPIEYASLRLEDGTRYFEYGNISIYVFCTSLFKSIVESQALMPWHWAHKIVPYWDLETRQQVVPSEPNAYKAERFLFDILPFAKRAQVIATRREEEFAPVKNLQGSDSVDSSRRAISEKARNWLRESGLMSSHTESNSKIIVEISPLLATCPGDLREQLPTFPSPTGPQILLEPPAE